MLFIANILTWALTIYSWIIILEVVVNWLIIFNVINTSNPQAQNLLKLLKKATDPVYSRLRKYIPPIGGLDLTPLIVLFAIWILQHLIWRFAYATYLPPM